MTEAIHPPLPLLALTVGVTGHRSLPDEDATKLRGRIAAVLARLAAKVSAVEGGHSALFEPCPAVLTILSPLAEGADQLAAEVAVEAGWRLHAMLPSARDAYAGDFDPPGRERLDALLARASSVWSAPTDAERGANAPPDYVLAGEATVAGCDILLAVWDGKQARGPGGTADVVEHALRRGVPVIHLHLHGRSGGGDSAAHVDDAVLWTGFESLQPAIMRRAPPRRPLSGAALEDVVEALLAPPAQDRDLRLFLAERERRFRTRPEWSLLLATAGIQPLRSSSFRVRRYREAAQADWAGYRAATLDMCGPSGGLELHEGAFAWADGLAQHYANVYRSGIILNFAGAALAVLLSLLAWLFPADKLALLVLELAVIAAVIANTARGTRREWHRRWLDYRFLAEQLRPLKSLKMVGAASPPFRGRSGTRPWTDWYALSVWRAMGPAPVVPDRGAVQRLARQVAEHELDGQIRYHAASAHRMHTLDHRLHNLGLALFLLTIGIGFVALAGLISGNHAIKQALPVLSVLSAALPTLSGAIFGVRGAGDFAATAGRSAETARRLAEAAAVLRGDGIDCATAAHATEEASSLMLADLAEWRTSYAYRKLAIPS